MYPYRNAACKASDDVVSSDLLSCKLEMTDTDYLPENMLFDAVRLRTRLASTGKKKKRPLEKKKTYLKTGC